MTSRRVSSIICRLGLLMLGAYLVSHAPNAVMGVVEAIVMIPIALIASHSFKRSVTVPDAMSREQSAAQKSTSESIG